jgi:prophage antirepressor-like protein
MPTDADPEIQLPTSCVSALVNGEPMIADTVLAEALGFSRGRKIREIIERHHDELLSYGKLQTGTVTTHGGTRPTAGRVYFLTEHQALLVTILSKAPRAPAVRRALIECFVAFRKGQQPRPQPQVRGPAEPTRCEWRGKELIRRHKLDLARAVMALDDLGVDVLAIDMRAVVQFSRFLSGREPAPVTTKGA